MLAQVLTAARPVSEGPLRATEMPVPEPGDAEILMRVRACGLCHTDLHIVEGDIAPPRLPLVPGHQVVGVVERAGPGATRFERGARVGAAWLNRTCGRCPFCLRGEENLCDDVRFTGYHADGGYAEFLVAPQDFVYALPAGYADEQAAPLLCAGIIGYRA